MNDIDALARTLFGEAEAGDIEDAQAIACVILNRVAYPNWPDTVREVCLQPWQFSCWNANDPNRARIIAAQPAGSEWLTKCYAVAREAIAGRLHDITNGATHYHTTYIKTPRWARGKSPVFETPAGRYNHLFYNNIDTPPPQSAAEALEQERPITETRTMRAGKVAAGGTVVAGIAEAAQHIAPAAGIFRDVAQAAPWVALAIIAAGVGYMVWARLDDRRAGAR